MVGAVPDAQIRGAFVVKPLKSPLTPISARDAALEMLEVPVLRPWFGFLLAAILSALSLPFLAISLLIAAICTAAVAVSSPFRKRRRSIDSDMGKTWAAKEFGFERAIEAYEELIDAHARRRR